MITREFRLKDFDGPLDLLLTLVGKAQIDIRDIFVSEITDQYLEIVRNAPDLNMDEASDFLVIAATLLEIKSRAMLPRRAWLSIYCSGSEAGRPTELRTVRYRISRGLVLISF